MSGRPDIRMDWIISRKGRLPKFPLINVNGNLIGIPVGRKWDQVGTCGKFIFASG